MEPNFTCFIAHSKRKLLVCSEYFIASQISFYAIFCENPITGPGPKIWVFLSTGRTPVWNWVPVGPRSGTGSRSDLGSAMCNYVLVSGLDAG